MAKRKVFDDFDPAPPGPSVSETLRSTRMAHGYDLRDVAAMLRIRYPYLLAIEEGRFDELPGSTYAIGFLRSYAECLGLDPDTVVTRYKDEAAGTVRRQELYLPTPAAEGGRASGGTLLLGTLVLAGIVYGGWYYLSATDRTVTDLVPTLPDRLVSLLDGVPSKPATPAPEQAGTAAQPGAEPSVPAPVIAAAPPPAAAPAPATPAPAPGAAAPGAAAKPPQGTAPAAPAPAASTVAGKPPTVAAVPPAVLPPAQSPLPSANAPSTNQAAGQGAGGQAPGQGVVNVPAPPPEDDEEASPQDPTPLNAAANPPAAPAAPTATVPANGKVYGTLNTNAKLVLKATQESWLQVRDGSEIVFTRVLKPGDTFRVPDKPNVKIRTGNAGGLVVMADGGESPPLGSVGQVLRDVAIDNHGVVRR
ncbi:helix-turn-helix domain-containing protein [Azospirillum sp.]|uniref:helix-turn-helix domain-containing protein n=1 Tax=Azospirillum sp. TaxID=34012 RepID=UPI002D5A79C1|nr:helix-turn-helix domain-containing protein [Azospirillum sp.]HYF89980.1 helix-turn-helix domain-containing protein [Azospirillum sp.]